MIKGKDIIVMAYKTMFESRVLDEKMLILIRQGKSYFHIGCMGHEAVQVALGQNLNPKKDYLFPYYRDQAICLALGQTAYECFLSFLGKKDDPHGGGRQMPMHYGNKRINIPSSSSSTGTQFLQALGLSMANKRLFLEKEEKELSVTVVCSGDGTTSQGEFYEAISWASKDKAPILFLVENNRYAISVPIDEQRPGGVIAENFMNFHGLKTFKLDGLDYFASFLMFKDIVSKIKKNEGPVLVDARVVRLLPHSSSDDHKKYRSHNDINKEMKMDPIKLLKDKLINEKIISESDLEKIESDIKNHVDESLEKAINATDPDPNTATMHVFAETESALSYEPNLDLGDEPYVMVDAINRALCEGLEENNKMLIFGQDVAHGKGGVFTATREITKKFGNDRCFNSPLAEASIVGVAIGYALRGFRPVPEIQFGDYIWTAMMQIRNELSCMRYRSNNDFSAPVVIRVPVGGYIHGGLCHSQNIEATFAHFPGLKIAMPSTAIDAYGLLKASFIQDDPVLFLEHKAIYRQNFAKSVLPKKSGYYLPFGKASIRCEGLHISVITYGIMVQRALEIAQILLKEGIKIEVIDLRSIVPYDEDLVFSSVKKTSKVLVLHEDTGFMGFGAELCAKIQEECFSYLDAPVMRLSGKDTPIPYSPNLENQVLPQPKDILASLRMLASY